MFVPFETLASHTRSLLVRSLDELYRQYFYDNISLAIDKEWVYCEQIDQHVALFNGGNISMGYLVVKAEEKSLDEFLDLLEVQQPAVQSGSTISDA